jgi:hypothetical protein
MKIAINYCFGGFSLSDTAIRRYAELKGIKYKEQESSILANTVFFHLVDDMGNVTEDIIDDRSISRDDSALIQVVEELGTDANGACANIGIVEIPEGVDWYIAEYDGQEVVHEKHRSWY